MKKKKTKFLIVKIGAIGDVIMALPMLNYIKTTYPNSEIFWVCGKISKEIIKATNLVDEIIEVDENKLFKGSFIEKFFEIFSIWRKIGFFKFFFQVVVAYRDFRYHILSIFVRCKEKRSFFFFRGRKKLINGRYMPSEYIRLVSQIDDFQMIDPILPDIKIPYFDKIDKIFNNKKKTIAIAPGGAINILSKDSVRRWHIENYVTIAEKLIDEGFDVFVTGGKDDLSLSSFFSKLDVINLIGKTEILELMDLYRRCNLVVTNDSGSLHLAKLSGGKVLSLFGPTEPRSRLKENGYDDIVIWGGSDLFCAPCYDGKCFAKCSNNICMKNISVNSVLQKIKEALK